MINTNKIIQTGDTVKDSLPPAVKTDQVLVQISRFYMDRCKAMQAGNTIAVELFNHQIANLKTQLERL